MTITISPRAASQPSASSSKPEHHVNPAHDEFARLMTFDAFGYRAGRALDQSDFVDRAPDSPRLLANARMVP